MNIDSNSYFKALFTAWHHTNSENETILKILFVYEEK